MKKKFNFEAKIRNNTFLKNYIENKIFKNLCTDELYCLQEDDCLTQMANLFNCLKKTKIEEENDNIFIDIDNLNSLSNKKDNKEDNKEEVIINNENNDEIIKTAKITNEKEKEENNKTLITFINDNVNKQIPDFNYFVKDIYPILNIYFDRELIIPNEINAATLNNEDECINLTLFFNGWDITNPFKNYSFALKNIKNLFLQLLFRLEKALSFFTTKYCHNFCGDLDIKLSILNIDRWFYNEEFFSLAGFHEILFILISIYLSIYLIFTSMSFCHDYSLTTITYCFHFWHLNFTHGYYLPQEQAQLFYCDSSDTIIINGEEYFNIPFLFTNKQNIVFYLSDFAISVLSLIEIGFFVYHHLFLSHSYIRMAVFSVIATKILFFVNDVINLFFGTKRFFKQSLFLNIIFIIIAFAIGFGLTVGERIWIQQQKVKTDKEKEEDLNTLIDILFTLIFYNEENKTTFVLEQYYENKGCYEIKLKFVPKNETLCTLINKCENNNTLLSVINEINNDVYFIKKIVSNNEVIFAKLISYTMTIKRILESNDNDETKINEIIAILEPNRLAALKDTIYAQNIFNYFNVINKNINILFDNILDHIHNICDDVSKETLVKVYDVEEIFINKFANQANLDANVSDEEALLKK